MKRENVMNCSFSSWYPVFKNNTIRSRVLKLPEDVLQYLHADGIVLPHSGHGLNSRAGAEWDSDDEDLNEVWTEDKSESSQVPSFPAFDEEMCKSIKALGGTVFPKLNWSSPKDASWIALSHSLACCSPSDVYLLLKSSDFIAHDLTNPFEVCKEREDSEEDKFDYELVLRRWHDLNPAGEFRCFIKDKVICGICQRHVGSYFENIAQEEKKILDGISIFFTEVVQDNFPDSNYVLDIYRNDEGRIYIVDFNPLCSVTDGLMFTWDEVKAFTSSSASKGAEFRYVKSDSGLQANPYHQYTVPRDLIDLTTGTDPHKLLDLLHLKIQQQEEESTSEDEESEKEPNPCLGEKYVDDKSKENNQTSTPQHS